jgi:hypothetical protein
MNRVIWLIVGLLLVGFVAGGFKQASGIWLPIGAIAAGIGLVASQQRKRSNEVGILIGAAVVLFMLFGLALKSGMLH